MAGSLTLREKLSSARLIASGNMPYLASALHGLVLREANVVVNGVPTLGVTRTGILMWHPAAVESFSLDELAGVLLHEVWHVLRDHHRRAAALGVVPEPTPEAKSKAYLWNLAGDASLNEALREAIAARTAAKPTTGRIVNPFVLPEGCVYPETLDQPPNLPVEERYRRLIEQAKQQDDAGDGKGGIGNGWCGSCAGHPLPDEPPGGGTAEGRSEVDLERIRRQTAEQIRNHAKGRGTMPAGFERWADEVLEPAKVDWRSELAREVRSAVAYRDGAGDLTWTHPSHLQAGLGFGPGCPIVPALWSPVPQVAMLFDTSGSMGKEELSAGASEVQGVLLALGSNVDFCATDSDVHELRTVRTIEEAIRSLKGGGGTDMRPGFEALLARRPKPSVIIVLTDGMLGGGCPEFEPEGVRVIWVLLGSSKCSPCGWGTQIFVDDGGAREAV